LLKSTELNEQDKSLIEVPMISVQTLCYSILFTAKLAFVDSLFFLETFLYCFVFLFYNSLEIVLFTYCKI